MDSLIGKQLGQYEILGQLGEGGMAAVYRARQTSVDRDVAIKIIRPDLVNTAGFLERFRREAKTVAALSHLHILKVFDYGSTDGLAYLVMELIEGGNLSRLILNAGALPMEQAARLFTQIASALDYAHAKGVIHRDLKPENVLLDQQGNAFLTDFGIARLVDASTSAITQTGAVMGTPAYMAPEVWQGEPADARTDIYALGVMLYNMLTGRAAFSADTPYAIMFKHLNELPVAASSLNREVWPTVDQVINTALEKRRDDRYQTAGEMAASFRQAIRVDSSGALPIPTPSKGINLTATATVLGGLPARVPPRSTTAATTRAGRDEPPTLATQRPAGQPANRASTQNRGVLLGAVVIALVIIGIGLTAWFSTQQNRAEAALAQALDQTRTAESTLAQQSQVAQAATQLAVALQQTALQQTAAQTRTQAAASSLIAMLPTETQPAGQPTVDPAIIAELTRLAQPTVTPTASITPSATPSLTSTVTPSQTPTATLTATLTATATATATLTVTASHTFTPSPTLDLALLAAQTIAPILTATAQRSQQEATLQEGSRRLDSTGTAISLAGTAAAQSIASTQTLAAFGFSMTQTAQAQVIVVTATADIAVVVTNCPNALPSRLVVGGTGRVTPGDPNRLRNAPSFAGRYLGQMPGGSTFVVKQGPTCADGIAWWLVVWNGIEGWTAEGQNGTYWLEPVGANGTTVSASCSGFQIPSRLRIGGTGKVRQGGISNALNSNPSRPSIDPNSIRLGSIPQGQTFIVLDGPVCGSDGILWWKVNYNGRVGWTGEGQGSEYWVEPVSS